MKTEISLTKKMRCRLTFEHACSFPNHETKTLTESYEARGKEKASQKDRSGGMEEVHKDKAYKKNPPSRLNDHFNSGCNIQICFMGV